VFLATRSISQVPGGSSSRVYPTLMENFQPPSQVNRSVGTTEEHAWQYRSKESQWYEGSECQVQGLFGCGLHTEEVEAFSQISGCLFDTVIGKGDSYIYMYLYICVYKDQI
jgi:hypothetical protein